MSGDTNLREALASLSPDRLQTLIDNPSAFHEFAAKCGRRLSASTDNSADRAALEQARIDTRLRGLDRARIKNKVRRTRAAWLSAAARIDALDGTVRGLSETKANATSKRASLIERQKKVAAEALLDDKPVPNNSAARKQIVREDERIEAAEHALLMAAEKRSELETCEREANAALCDEVHDLVGAAALVALQRARTALTALAPELADLWAGDLVRESLLGAAWSFDSTRVRPESGSILVRALIDAVPATLRTAELDEVAIRSSAERIAANIIAEIQENVT